MFGFIPYSADSDVVLIIIGVVISLILFIFGMIFSSPSPSKDISPDRMNKDTLVLSRENQKVFNKIVRVDNKLLFFPKEGVRKAKVHVICFAGEKKALITSELTFTDDPSVIKIPSKSEEVKVAAYSSNGEAIECEKVVNNHFGLQIGLAVGLTLIPVIISILITDYMVSIAYADVDLTVLLYTSIIPLVNAVIFIIYALGAKKRGK